MFCNTPHVVYPYIRWWMFGVFVSFGYCKKCCNYCFLCTSSFEYLFIFLLIYIGVELLCHVMILSLTFSSNAKLFSKVSVSYLCPTIDCLCIFCVKLSINILWSFYIELAFSYWGVSNFFFLFYLFFIVLTSFFHMWIFSVQGTCCCVYSSP